MKPKPIPQYEFGFTGQTFNLIADQTGDGERMSREQEDRRMALETADQNQTQFHDYQRIEHALRPAGVQGRGR